MKKQPTGYAGADIIRDRYVVCVLDEEGKHPHYAKGRCDTLKGRQKFFSNIPPNTPLMIVESPLAVLALHLLGAALVVIQKEREGYAVWEKAGIKRGERMANFAANVLFTTSQEIPLTEKQEHQLLAMQGREMETLQSITDGSNRIIDRILEGSATEADIKQAFENEYQSRVGQYLIDKEEDNVPNVSFAEDDESFFASLYRLLKNIE
ncbi:MAG: hypothetical protein ACQ5SW_08985 [Sphaerochaetaceae bacterium]